jgi:EAL domain-containing protein (putative c-di-GMP-specific phosphodiesterase class I)
VAVNISVRQLREATFVDLVRNTLAETGLAPGRLCLEVSESIMMVASSTAEEVLRRLRALGVQIAMDDFGTGYSSLSSLRRLPIDVLKIDRSFVATLGGAERDDAVVEAVIRLAEALGLSVVAEGIERPEQTVRLRQLGCHLGQGYLFSRPVPADAITGMCGSTGFDSVVADAAAAA